MQAFLHLLVKRDGGLLLTTLLIGGGREHDRKDQLTAGRFCSPRPRAESAARHSVGSNQPQGGGGGGGGSLTAGNPSQVYLKRCGESVGTERRRGEGVLPPLLLLSAATAAAAQSKRSKVIRSHFHNRKVQQNSHAVKQKQINKKHTKKSEGYVLKKLLGKFRVN